MMVAIHSHIKDFFKTEIQTVEIYNEFSLQHEMGIFLRNKIPEDYKVQFERNISYFGIKNGDGLIVKREIDISIFNSNKSEKYAIELKYPTNGQFPEQMYSFVKDVRFMEQLKNKEGFTNTFCVVLVLQSPFYRGKQDGIYKHFRNEPINSIYGEICKPTGQSKNKESIQIDGKYNFKWNNIDGKEEKYYIIKI